MKKIVAVFLLAFFSFVSFASPFVVIAAGPSLSSSDTIAGYPSLVRAGSLPPSMSVVLEILKPDNTPIRIPLKASAEGLLTYSISDFHTQLAGTYRIRLVADQSYAELVTSQFTVYADKPSPLKSQFFSDKDIILADGNDRATVTVLLKDDFDNPIKNHVVKVISSRKEDTLQTDTSTSLTGQDGKATFSLSSTKDGVAALTAMDMTLNEVLDKRLQLVAQARISSGSSSVSTQKTSQLQKTYDYVSTGGLGSSLLGTSFLQQESTSALKASAGAATPTNTAKTLKMTPTKTQVEVGERFGVSVEVLTQEGMPALDYRGTVQFQLIGKDGQSTTLVDGTLPAVNNDNKYTFDGTEQGVKRFDKTLLFNSSGAKTIRVRDLDNPTLTDQITVIVGQGVVTPTEKITIQAPTPDAVLATKEILIAGQTSAFMKLKIFDNDVEIAQSDADRTGAFKLTLSNLADGTHTLSIKGFDPTGAQLAASDVVKFTVRATPPWVNKLTMIPSTDLYRPGQEVRVSVESEPDLKSAILQLEGVDYTMQADPILKGTYFTTITVPARAGTYSFTARIENKFGIPSVVPLTQPLVVKDLSFAMNKVNIDTVDSSTVKITWERSQDMSGVLSYRVSYGTDPSVLTGKVSIEPTKDTATISDLEPNTTYYFAFEVLGQGDSVLKKSEIIKKQLPATLGFANLSAVPGNKSIALSWELTGPKDVLKKIRILYGVAPDTYPKEVFVTLDKNTALLPALADAQTHYIRLQAYDKNDAVIVQSDEVSATPLNGQGGNTGGMGGCMPGDVDGLHVIVKNHQKVLVWNVADGAEGYRIHVGTKPGVYDLPTTDVEQNQYVLPPMDTAQKRYYFAVTALCGGNESVNLSRAVRVETGPALLWLLSLAGGAGYLGFRVQRRKQQLL